MKKILFIAAAFALNVSVHAQSSLDYKLDFKAKVYNQQKACEAKGTVAQADKAITVIGTLRDGALCPTQELESLGVKVISEIYGLVVMKVDMSQLEALGKVKVFSEISANEIPEQKNDQSHVLSHVTDVQDPNNLPEGLKQIYTGKGVIIGTVDGGFDFQHINFKDADGNSRIKRVWMVKDDAYLEEENTPEGIAALTTDNDGGSHGSHTLGTSAGSYNGEYTLRDGSKISGMRGAAYESEIVLGTLGPDATTFQAISNMWDYARLQKKPLMVSLSIVSSDVWMDGKNMYTTFFRNITKGGTQDSLLINLAAGNEGWEKKYFRKELSVGEKITTQVAFSSVTLAEITLASDDTTPFSVTLYGYDKDGNIAHTYKLDQADGQVHDIFGNLQYMIGYDQNHDGRYYVTMGSPAAVEKVDADYVMEISAAEKGCTVRSCLSHANCSNKINGVEKTELFNPDDNNSFGNWCQHKYALSVGAYTSRVSQELYSGEIYGTLSNPIFGDHKPCTLYDIAPFSSWVDVPYKNNTDSIGVDFLAPGNVVLSSVNHYDTTVDQYLVAKADDTNFLGAMYGTSMATPNASGIMALWLQACPNLNVAKVREIIKKTADNDDFTRANPRRAGMGKINCLAGLLEILSNYSPTGINDVLCTKGNASNAGADADSLIDSKPNCKFIESGHIIIVKNGRKYNVVGQKL